MIWITTLCLLAIAAWLLFNALNERQWVQDHSHDELVASDEGLLPSFSALTGTALPEGKVKDSIDQIGTKVSTAASKVQEQASTAASKVQEKATAYGDKFLESRSAARAADPDQESTASGKQESIIGKMVASAGAKAERFDERFDAKAKLATDTNTTADEGGSFINRATHVVTQKSEEIGHRVAKTVRNTADKYAETGRITAEDSTLGKMVGKVSGSVETLGNKLEERLLKSRSKVDVHDAEQSSDDLISRVADKVEASASKIEAKVD